MIRGWVKNNFSKFDHSCKKVIITIDLTFKLLNLLELYNDLRRLLSYSLI